MSLRSAIAAAALVVAAAAPVTGVAAPSPSDLEAELVCPTCDTTLDQSNAPVAQRMKQIIRQRIAAGRTEEQIKDELVEQFGPGVLAEPRKSGFDLLAWVLPLGLLALGALGVGVVAWGWSHRRGEPTRDEPLDPALERRLDSELERFDG